MKIINIDKERNEAIINYNGKEILSATIERFFFVKNKLHIKVKLPDWCCNGQYGLFDISDKFELLKKGAVMKETKVYVDDETLMKCERYRHNSCPIIQTHDRELVRQVCEKIKEFCENNKYRCNKYFLLYSIGLNVKLVNKNKEGQKETFYEFLDKIQKEFEDGK